MPDIVIALFICAVFFMVLALGAWAADRRPAPPRPERTRIPEREHELLGDDWRDKVHDYADTRHERWNAIRREADDD